MEPSEAIKQMILAKAFLYLMVAILTFLMAKLLDRYTKKTFSLFSREEKVFISILSIILMCLAGVIISYAGYLIITIDYQLIHIYSDLGLF